MGARNKRAIGTVAETRIQEYLIEHGYVILEMNFYCKQGEVDIIAKQGAYYVFIEVKYRSSKGYGMPEEAVGRSKQKRISHAALYYLYSHNLPEATPVRFDVAAVFNNEIHYIENAFSFLY